MVIGRFSGVEFCSKVRQYSGRWLLLCLIMAAVIYPVGSVLAAEELDMAAALDSVGIIIAAAMVFLMHAGFAMMETGFTCKKCREHHYEKLYDLLCMH